MAAPKPASKTISKAPAKPKAKSKKATVKARAKPAKAKAKPAAKAKATPKAKAKVAPKGKPAPKPKAAPQAKAASKVKVAPKTKPTPKAKAAPKAKLTPKAKAAPKATPGPAREALKALAMKKAIAEVISPIESGTAVVDAYMRDVDHPFKAEMEAVRAIILSASPKLSERIKWNAPSFFYKEDLGAFHPRATEYAHLILLFPDGMGIPAKNSLLEGKEKDRREAKFYSLADVETKKAQLTKLVKGWVALRDK